jgi:hypothetical protein
VLAAERALPVVDRGGVADEGGDAPCWSHLLDESSAIDR